MSSDAPFSFPFDDFSWPGNNFFTGESPQGEFLQFLVLDRLIVTDNPAAQAIIMVMRDSQQPRKPGYGVSLTVGQAAQVVSLLRQSIAHIEGIILPEAGSTYDEGKEREDNEYD
jgi:hypothetical protein